MATSMTDIVVNMIVFFSAVLLTDLLLLLASMVLAEAKWTSLDLPQMVKLRWHRDSRSDHCADCGCNCHREFEVMNTRRALAAAAGLRWISWERMGSQEQCPQAPRNLVASPAAEDGWIFTHPPMRVRVVCTYNMSSANDCNPPPPPPPDLPRFLALSLAPYSLCSSHAFDLHPPACCSQIPRHVTPLGLPVNSISCHRKSPERSPLEAAG
eukprot:762659-Hanusia_phi.AAC.2